MSSSLGPLNLPCRWSIGSQIRPLALAVPTIAVILRTAPLEVGEGSSK